MFSILHYTRSTRRLATALAALLALGAPLLSEAAARAQLDRSATTPDQPLTLSITSDAASRGTQPDLTPLRQDFQVLGTSTGSETTIVNGHRSDHLRWDIRLQPKHAGRVEIPPIVVGVDRTAALQVDVAEASPAQHAVDAQHAFLEVDANAASQSPYVQQQIPYTVRLFYDDSVTPAQLDAPAPENAIVDQLGPDKRYTATRRGHQYNVIERDYAIAPEKSGTLVIAPPEFRGTEAATGTPAEGPDPRDDVVSRMLANTPFANMPGVRAALEAGSPFAQDTRPITARGRQVMLEVKPRPAGVQGDWLPAEQLALQDSWASGVPAFKVGEPVTRVITIQAKGLAASQIPSLPIASPANARVYPETPENQSRTDGQSIYGSSKQSVTYLPTQAGALDLPAVDLTWWDVRSDVQRHATLPAFHLQVAPGVAGAQAGRAPPVTAVVPAGEPNAVGAFARQPGVVDLSAKVIAGLIICAALAALLAMGLRRRRRSSRGAAGHAGEADAMPRKAATMRALRDACATHAAPEAARALLELGRLEWPNDPPHGLDALAARLESGRHEVVELDRCLYGSGKSRWDGSALWQRVRGGLRSERIARPPEPSGLDPLYPQPAH